MEKKEREMRIRNHMRYWSLVDEVRDMSLNALCDDLSVSDVISVLDRIKTELLQQEVIITMEETQNEPEEESEDSNVVEHPQTDIKASVSLVDPTALIEEKIRGLYV